MHLGPHHRCRKILNIGGALDIIAREACAKFVGHAHISFKPRPLRHAGKSFLAVAMKEQTVSQANHSLQLLKDS